MGLILLKPAAVVLLAALIAAPAHAATREDAIVMMGISAGKQTLGPLGNNGAPTSWNL